MSVVAADDAVLRVGIYNNAPKIFMDGETPSGIWVDLLREIAQQEHWQVTYVPCEWQACLDALRAGHIDLMPDVAYNAERAALFSFHEKPALRSWSELYTRTDAPIESILDLANKRVAVLDGAVQINAFKAMVAGFDVPVTLVPLPTFEAVFAAVADRSVDAGIVNNRYGEYNAVRNGLIGSPIVFQPAKLFFAATRNTHGDVLRTIDRYVGEWQQDPQSVYFEVLHKWRDQTELAATPRRLWVVVGAVGLLALVAVGVGLFLLRTVWLKNRLVRMEHARMQAMLDAMPDPLFELGLDGTYFDCHAPRAERLLPSRPSCWGKRWCK
ncbi:MAG: transporter substrate-binding domain-containing protein [Burkholderiales bacterium]|nr:transporter substrate-binding domain-containing protein [Burkholderiales bacterium]